MQKTSLIIGATGQDGLFLTEILLENGHRVYGTTRDIGSAVAQRFRRLRHSATLVEFAPGNSQLLEKMITELAPDEIYNLAAVSSVSESFKHPELTFDVNFRHVQDLLNIISSLPGFGNTRIFQASSSEMFGNSTKLPHFEDSKLNPLSPYAESKVMAHLECQKFRIEKGLHVVTGILFNHESEYRESKFVGMKIAEAIFEFSNGRREKVKFGDLSVSRDWGYAKDYMKAVSKSLSAETADDYIVATGTSRSLREFIQVGFQIANINAEIDDLIEESVEFSRPTDIEATSGDAGKAQRILGWKPETSFESMVKIMIDSKKNDVKV